MVNTEPESDVLDFIVEIKKQIKEILNRDLYMIALDKRSIEKWNSMYGENPDYKETKELLVCLEVLLVDTEITNLKHKQEIVV